MGKSDRLKFIIQNECARICDPWLKDPLWVIPAAVRESSNKEEEQVGKRSRIRGGTEAQG